MGHTTNTSLHGTPHHPSNPKPRQTRASLPPKPVSQKRARNTASTAAVPPPPHPAHPVRPRRSWSRRSASWTPEEDAKLIQLVQKETSVPPSITASKTWSRVAAQLTNRTGKQCRERYLNQLKPGIRRDPWSPEEERILHEAHARYGNKWVTIAGQLPGRTDNCVKNHWNSMLRKRQRREAALKAVQDGRNSKVPSVLHIATDLDHKPDPDHSVYTGCGTPSGASSSNHDLPSSSGVPSPFAASSPITPKRDVKLQISSLVAASSKDVPPLNSPYIIGKIFSRSHSPGNPLLESGQRQNLPSDSQPVLPQGHDHTKRHTRSSSASAGNSHPGFHYQHNAQDGEPLPLSCSTPLEVHALGTAADGDATTKHAAGCHRHLRRSARLTSASLHKSKGGSSDWKSKPSGIKKRATSTKGQRHGEGVGNPLAALAAAASSVPPSPLTPESRFSGTSRSRSVSPSPRAVPDLGKTSSGSGMSAAKLSTNVADKRIDTSDSNQAKHLENSGNIAVKGTMGAEPLNETKNGERAEVGLKKRCNEDNRGGTEMHSLVSGDQGYGIERR